MNIANASTQPAARARPLPRDARSRSRPPLSPETRERALALAEDLRRQLAVVIRCELRSIERSDGWEPIFRFDRMRYERALGRVLRILGGTP